MNRKEYMRLLLAKSDEMDTPELAKTLEIARYSKGRKTIRRAILSDMLERVHSSWRAADDWMNTEVIRYESMFVLEWDELEVCIDKAQELSMKPVRTEVDESTMTRMLWHMISMLSEQEWLDRILEEAEARHFGHLAWQLMAVRLACKSALLMLEFDPQFDVATERF